MAFTVAAVFSDNMVLQRRKNIKIFGSAADSERITVTLCGVTAEAVCENSRWCAVLPAFEAGSGYELTVCCGDEEKRFSNIAIGEVWLAGGQSNMELELQNCSEWPQVQALEPDDLLRFYYTQKKSYMDEDFFISEAQTAWSIAGSEEMKFWSAVGYFFAARLRRELDVPVGIIGCNWGGTSASAWMDIPTLYADSDTRSYVDEYEYAIGGKSVEQQLADFAEYTEYHARFEKNMAALYAERPDIEWDEALSIVGECRWPGPMNCANPYRPAGLYECMLKRIIPYSLRGFIYYQGESDDHKPTMYYKLFSDMIGCWRREWEDDTLPFICVQLPMHRYKGEPDRKNWPLIREAQMRVYDTVKHTGIAVAIDQGEWNEIHPKAKSIVGERLALQAMYSVYQLIYIHTASGPIFSRCEYCGDSLRLYFDNAQGGFICRADTISGFEAAGADKVYHPAQAEIDGENIIVRSADISEPKFVRYLWTNYAEVPLFGSNGLPLAPFRSSRNDGSESELDLSGK